MSGPHDPDYAQAAERVQAEGRLHRKVRWFVGAHIAAVGLIYVVALSIGGGHAPPPFPPDLAVNHRHSTPAPGDAPPARAQRQTPTPLADRTDRLGAAASVLAQREGADLAPPWVVDSGGVVRIRHD